MNPVIVAFLFVLISVLSVSAQQAKSTPNKPVASQGTTAPQDKAIEAKILAKLKKSKIGNDGFKIRVQGGVAFWDGATSIPQHKGAATRMAKSAGATRVVNNIQVSEDAKQKAAANLDTGRRRVQVKRGDARSQP